MFATSSFTVNMHFCSNKLVDMAVFTKVKVCEAPFQAQNNPTQKCSFEKKGCCDNKSFVKKGTDNLQITSFEGENQNLISPQIFYYRYIDLFEGLEENTSPFLNYNPPRLAKNLHVFYEVYLI